MGAGSKLGPEREAGRNLISIALSPHPLCTIHILVLIDTEKRFVFSHVKLVWSFRVVSQETKASLLQILMASCFRSARGMKLITRTIFLCEQHWFLNRSAPICADILLTKTCRCVWTSTLRLPFSARRLIGSTLWREVNYLKMILVRPYLSPLASLWIFDVI